MKKKTTPSKCFMNACCLMVVISFLGNSSPAAGPGISCSSQTDSKVSVHPEVLRRCESGQTSWLEASRRSQGNPMNQWQNLLTKIHQLKASWPKESWTSIDPYEPQKGPKYRLFEGPDQGFFDVLDFFASEYPQGIEFDIIPTPVRDSDNPFHAVRMDLNGDGFDDLVRFGSSGMYQAEVLHLDRARGIRALLKNSNGNFSSADRDAVSIFDQLIGQLGQEKDLFALANPSSPVRHPATRGGLAQRPYLGWVPEPHDVCLKNEELPIYQRVAQEVEKNHFMICHVTPNSKVSNESTMIYEDPQFTRGVVINLGRKSADKHRFWIQPFLFASEKFSGQAALFPRHLEDRILIYSQSGSLFQNSRQIDVFAIPSESFSAQNEVDQIQRLQPVTSFTLRGIPGVLRSLELVDKDRVRITYEELRSDDSHLIKRTSVVRPFQKDGSF